MIKHVMVTGALGFIGKNFVLALKRFPEVRISLIDIDSSSSFQEEALDSCDALVHLAGVNRPERVAEFEAANVGYLATLLSGLERRGRHPLIILSSSAQALIDTPYGRSKKQAENLLIEYARRTKAPVRIFRFPGVFGKWCRPNYNSVVATFCHNIARDLPIQISDPTREIEIVHVDDVVEALISSVNEGTDRKGIEFEQAKPTYRVKLGELADRIRRFRAGRISLVQPDLQDSLERRLYGTYISYLPEDGFDYEPSQKTDDRGSLAEILKFDGYGQLFVSRTLPGITRGNHYHDLKVEKFIVLEGEAIIRFRKMDTDELVEYPLTGSDTRIVDIPPGWTHSIENVGLSEMIVLFWASEVFDPKKPDTYPAEVKK